jgi:tetratricopeptide (TPR) repeat protein
MRRLACASFALLVLASFGPSRAEEPPETYVNGLRLAQEGKHRQALALFRRVVKDHPKLPGLHYNMGNVLVRLGERSEAARAYQEAIAIDPKDADAYYNLAMVYSTMDEMGLALGALEEVVRIRPDDGEAFYRLAMGYHTLRNAQRAWSYLTLAKKAGYPVPPELEEALKGQMEPAAGKGNP